MITYLFGGVKNHDKGLLRATSLVNNTLQELGMGMKEINLGPPTGLPTYDGVPSSEAAVIIDNIRASSGVVFATTAGPSGASSVLHTFLEHLEQEGNVLQDKNCMILVLSQTGDFGVVNYLSRYINSLGGYDSVRMVLDQSFFERGANQEMAEKQIEDFYRMVKAKRQFYRPLATPVEQVRPYNFQSEAVGHMQQPLVEEDPYITNHADFVKAGGGQQGYDLSQAGQSVPAQAPVYQQAPVTDYNQQLDSRSSAILQNYEALSQQEQNHGGAVYTPSSPSPMPTMPATPNMQGGSRAANLYGQMAPQQPQQPVPPVPQFSPNQVDDVEEISNFFARKMQPTPHGTNYASGLQGDMEQGAIWQPSQPVQQQQPEPVFSPTLNPSLPNSPANQWFANETANQPKNARQLTASLVHHYQPHVAGDLQCLLQVEISGPNGFYGYLDINGPNCTYGDGRVDNPSLTVISDETNWNNVITGSMSAQKAFMTGNLKIKGNFVLLTRFDQIFNTSKNY